MNINRLRELKRKLANEKDFSKIWLFYMDHFADHREFTELGEPAQSDYLSAVLQKSCQQLFGKTIKITNFLLIYIAEHRFFHGPFMVEGWIGGVIYFEDTKNGLLALSSPFSSTDEVKYLRFTEALRLSDPHDRN